MYLSFKTIFFRQKISQVDCFLKSMNYVVPSRLNFLRGPALKSISITNNRLSILNNGIICSLGRKYFSPCFHFSLPSFYYFFNHMWKISLAGFSIAQHDLFRISSTSTNTFLTFQDRSECLPHRNSIRTVELQNTANWMWQNTIKAIPQNKQLGLESDKSKKPRRKKINVDININLWPMVAVLSQS